MQATCETSAIEISVVIPTLNESQNLSILLPDLKRVLETFGCSHEILVVDADSTDHTLEIAQTHGAVGFVQQGWGYGSALREAFERSRGKFIITMDADLSHNPYIVKQLYRNRYLADIVIASRYIKYGFSNASWFRKALSFILNKTFRIILDLPIHDISSGFRLYRSDILKTFQLQSNGYEILEEILIKAYMQGYTIEEISFHYLPRHSGRSHIKLLRFGMACLKTIYTFWRQRNSIFSADYDERAFYSRIPIQRYWQRERYRIILDFSEQFDRIIDIGCGSSKILEAIPQSIGMDIALNKLRYRKRLSNSLVNADIFAIPFKSACFNEIICSEVIEHVKESDTIFIEFNRILKPGGVLIIGTPDYSKRLWCLIEELYKRVHPGGYAHEHITHYSYKSLLERLRKYGFELIAHRYILGSELIMKARKTS